MDKVKKIEAEEVEEKIKGLIKEIKESEKEEARINARRNRDFLKLVLGTAFVTAGAVLICARLDSVTTIGIGLIFATIGGILLFKLSKTMCSGKT